MGWAMLQRVLALSIGLSVSVSSFGCRDLSYREPGAENLAPRVGFVGLSDSDSLSMRPRIEISAEDADGVATVSLSCGVNEGGPFIPLVSWNAAPWAAEVPLSNCIAGATLDSDGNARVTLVARATDLLGATGSASLTVSVNPRVPSVIVNAPSRVRPGATFTVTLTSSEQLASPPSLLVDGAPIAVTALGEDPVYAAEVTAPQVGTGIPGLPEDLATLEDIERTLTLDITAIGEQGNRVDLRREVKVSRLLWERQIPARLLQFERGSRPILPRPSASGLWVPIDIEFTPQGPSGWRPAFLRASDGHFTAPLVGAHVGIDFTAGGPPLLEDPESVLTRMVDEHGEQLAEWKEVIPFEALFHFPDRTCVVEDTRGQCFQAPVSLRCYGPGSQVQNTSPFEVSTGSSPNWVATSGEVAVGLELYALGCAAPDMNTILWATPTTGSALGTIPGVGAFERLLPAGDSGHFFVAFVDAAGGSRQVGRIQFGQYTPLPITPQHALIAARDDGTLLEVETRADVTVLSSLEPTGESTSQTLPIRLEPVGVDSVLPQNVVVFPDGRFAFVARASDYSRVIVAVDEDLTPRWIFRHARPTATTHLVRSGDGPLFFVDVENDYVAAFHAEW